MNIYQTTPGMRHVYALRAARIPEEWQLAIEIMETAGARVILEDTGREYVVKVHVPGQRQVRKASTSGYPVAGAFEAWKQTQGKDGE